MCKLLLLSGLFLLSQVDAEEEEWMPWGGGGDCTPGMGYFSGCDNEKEYCDPDTSKCVKRSDDGACSWDYHCTKDTHFCDDSKKKDDKEKKDEKKKDKLGTCAKRKENGQSCTKDNECQNSCIGNECGEKGNCRPGMGRFTGCDNEKEYCASDSYNCIKKSDDGECSADYHCTKDTHFCDDELETCAERKENGESCTKDTGCQNSCIRNECGEKGNCKPGMGRFTGCDEEKEYCDPDSYNCVKRSDDGACSYDYHCTRDTHFCGDKLKTCVKSKENGKSCTRDSECQNSCTANECSDWSIAEMGEDLQDTLSWVVKKMKASLCGAIIGIWDNIVMGTMKWAIIKMSDMIVEPLNGFLDIPESGPLLESKDVLKTEYTNKIPQITTQQTEEWGRENILEPISNLLGLDCDYGSIQEKYNEMFAQRRRVEEQDSETESDATGSAADMGMGDFDPMEIASKLMGVVQNSTAFVLEIKKMVGTMVNVAANAVTIPLMEVINEVLDQSKDFVLGLGLPGVGPAVLAMWLPMKKHIKSALDILTKQMGIAVTGYVNGPLETIIEKVYELVDPETMKMLVSTASLVSNPETMKTLTALVSTLVPPETEPASDDNAEKTEVEAKIEEEATAVEATAVEAARKVEEEITTISL